MILNAIHKEEFPALDLMRQVRYMHVGVNHWY